MVLSMNRFILYYANELRFFKAFSKLKIVYFLGKYTNVLKMTCYGLVVAENVLLVTGSLLSIYFNGLSTEYPFEIVALVNLTIAVLALLAFLLREMPLIV